MEVIRIRDFSDKKVLMPTNNIAYVTEYNNKSLPQIKSCLHLKSETALFLSQSTIEYIELKLNEYENK